MRRAVWAMALAVGALLIPTVVTAATAEAISVTIVNDRAGAVRAETLLPENCSPGLEARLGPGESISYRCVIENPIKRTSFSLRLLFPERVACEAYWRPFDFPKSYEVSTSVRYEYTGVHCAIKNLGGDAYVFTIR